MRAAILALLLLGCSSRVEPTASDDATTSEVSVDTSIDVSPEVAVDSNPAAACATTFGDKLTNAFGRLDGVVTAIVRQMDTSCPEGTSPTHIVLQVKSMGEVYRMVVNVQSDRGTDLDVRFAMLHRPGLSPWIEAWHAPAALDYPSMLMVHADATFTPTKKEDLVAKLVDAIPIGSEVSVYATSSGGSSAHLVHRHASTDDGAIVVDPRGASPLWLLFHFADQTF
jgi:hypothetical protein